MKTDDKTYGVNAPPTKPGPYKFRCCDCGAEAVGEVDQFGIDEGWRDGLLRCDSCCRKAEEEMTREFERTGLDNDEPVLFEVKTPKPS